MTNIRFDHCVIRVSNWGASNSFYRDVMGAEVVSQGEGWAYRFGDTQLNCHGPGIDTSPVAKRRRARSMRTPAARGSRASASERAASPSWKRPVTISDLARSR